MEAPRVNDDTLQPGGTLARRINHDKPRRPKPATGSGVAYQLCIWDSGEKIILQAQFCIMCNVNLRVKHFGASSHDQNTR